MYIPSGNAKLLIILKCFDFIVNVFNGSTLVLSYILQFG